MNAIFQAMTFVSTGINEEITRFAQEQDALRNHSAEADLERLYEESEPETEEETQPLPPPPQKKKGLFGLGRKKDKSKKRV